MEMLPLKNALALRGNGLPARRAGSGTAIQTPSGGVSAFFALEAFDRRLGMAIYSLQVMNYTAAALVCRVWAISRNGQATLAHPVLVEVLPCSTLETEIPVLPATLPPFERAMVEVAGQGVHCLVEAPPPIVKPVHRAYLIAAASVAAGLTLFGMAAVLRAAVPRIDAFALPPQALAGTTVRAEYSAAGAGALSYSVLTPDGRTLEAGKLANRAGSIPIEVPASRQPGAYTVEMIMAGPLGRANETRVLNTLVSLARGAAIGNISVHPMVAQPGQTIIVSYAAVGNGGYLRLVGGDGSIWGQEPFSHTGQTEFVVPPVRSGPLQVLLHVTKGTSNAQSVAGFMVGGAAAAQAAPVQASQVVADDDPNAVSSSTDANGTFDVLTKTVKSGGTIQVKIFSPRNGMRISLMDTQSHEISGLNVGADAEVVTLRAPVVQMQTKYIVEASFTDGFGQETVVEPVSVVP